MSDDFAFPKVPVELRPLFLDVMDALRDELREPGHRAGRSEVLLMNQIRHLFEGYTTPAKPRDDADYGPQASACRRFADPDGYVKDITRIVNTVTGEIVTLPEPITVHLRDIDRVLDEYQARFLAEWEAGAEERAKRSRVFFGGEL